MGKFDVANAWFTFPVIVKEKTTVFAGCPGAGENLRSGNILYLIDQRMPDGVPGDGQGWN